MAQLEHDSIAPTLDLSDDDILRNLSDKCVRSVNGMCKSNHTKIGGGMGQERESVCVYVSPSPSLLPFSVYYMLPKSSDSALPPTAHPGRRVTDKILDLCPASREDFALCLRTIKLWAKRTCTSHFPHIQQQLRPLSLSHTRAHACTHTPTVSHSLVPSPPLPPSPPPLSHLLVPSLLSDFSVFHRDHVFLRSPYCHTHRARCVFKRVWICWRCALGNPRGKDLSGMFFMPPPSLSRSPFLFPFPLLCSLCVGWFCFGASPHPP